MRALAESLDFEVCGRRMAQHCRFGAALAALARQNAALAPLWRAFGAALAPLGRQNGALASLWGGSGACFAPFFVTFELLVAAFWLILAPKGTSNLNVHLWPCDFAILL